MMSQLTGRSDVKETAFWRNYFYHCGKVRRDVVDTRQPVETNVTASRNALNIGGSLVDSVITENNEQHFGSSIEITGISSSVLTDDSSLVPSSLQEDDSSYVIPSAPNSLNTFATTRSVDDLVLVGREQSDT